jgi:hypothetical protein
MRPRSPIGKCLAGMVLAWGCLACLPLGAETLEELDALSDLSADEAAGINAASAQASRGEYLDALATLERVLAVHPKSRAARLIHAVYLCRIDDRRGGLVELDRLKEKHYERQQLAEARAICAPGGR